MSRVFAALLAAAFALALGLASQSHALQDRSGHTPTPVDSYRELVVFEIDGCPLCQIFKRDVASAYAQTPRAKAIPMRFIDVARVDTDRLNIAQPITIAPTIVLMKGGREVARIQGHPGRQNFFRLIEAMMARSE